MSHGGHAPLRQKRFHCDINIIYDGHRWHVDSFPLLAGLGEREEVSVNLLDVNAASRCRFSSERT